jgi:hypothetical protein
MGSWRAGCGESRTSGSEGGPEKPTDRETAGRSGPTPTRRVAFLLVDQTGSGEARRLLMARPRGGVLVVVRAWESHVHGEGG